jgi:hypothetical protein
MIKNYTRAIVGIAVSLFMVSMANAAVTGPTYPIPGGWSYANDGGNPGGTGGLTWTHSMDNPSLFDEVYWGLTDDMWQPGPGVGSSMNGTLSAMSWDSLTATQSIWTGTTTVNHQSNGLTNVETRMVATIISGGDGWHTSASIGLADPVATPVVAKFADPASSLVVNLAFEARTAGSVGAWSSFYGYFDPITGESEDGKAQTSFQGAISYSAVPVPAAVWLFGSALAGLGWMRRKQTT